MPNRHQAIISINDVLIYWRICAFLGLDDLKRFLINQYIFVTRMNTFNSTNRQIICHEILHILHTLMYVFFNHAFLISRKSPKLIKEYLWIAFRATGQKSTLHITYFQANVVIGSNIQSCGQCQSIIYKTLMFSNKLGIKFRTQSQFHSYIHGAPSYYWWCTYLQNKDGSFSFWELHRNK